MNKSGNRKTLNDILLVISVIAVSVIILFIVNSSRTDGNTVSVIIDGEVSEVFDISDDITYIIDSGNGFKNTLIIRDGKALIESANCPDKTCVKHRPIYKSGESIICLPHKLVIEVCEKEGSV